MFSNPILQKIRKAEKEEPQNISNTFKNNKIRAKFQNKIRVSNLEFFPIKNVLLQ